MVPLIGALWAEFSFSQRWWKRTIVPMVVQSTVVRTGGAGCHWQAVEQMSIVLEEPAHPKTIPKQQLAPVGTAPATETQIQPLQPTGSGFGAGVKSSFTMVALKPGQSPTTAHGIGAAQLLGRKWM